jgi:hypothetical protein
MIGQHDPRVDGERAVRPRGSDRIAKGVYFGYQQFGAPISQIDSEEV